MDETRKFVDQQERLSKVLEDAIRPSEEFRALVSRLTAPSPAQQALADAVKSVSGPLRNMELEHLADLPGMEPIASACTRMAEEMAPMREQFQRMQRLSDSFRISDECMSAMQRLSDQVSAAAVTIREREPEYLYVPPALPLPEPKVSPSADVLQVIKERLDAERADHEDPRHTVMLLVTLLDGTQVTMRQMSVEGEHLIRITGVDTRTNKERTVTVGAQAFQYEFVLIEHKPDLRPVK